MAELDVAGGPLAIVESENLTLEDENTRLRRELNKLGDKGKAAAASVPRGRR